MRRFQVASLLTLLAIVTLIVKSRLESHMAAQAKPDPAVPNGPRK